MSSSVSLSNQQQTTSNEYNNNDDDLFHCGKCKITFALLPEFLQHKVNYHSRSTTEQQQSINEIIEYQEYNDYQENCIYSNELQSQSNGMVDKYFIENSEPPPLISCNAPIYSTVNEKKVKVAEIPENQISKNFIVCKSNFVYTCQLCNSYETNKKSNFEQHLKKHSQEKCFQCEICGRAFVQKSHLKKHIQTHKVWVHTKNNKIPCEYLPEKGAYKCNFCELAFENLIQVRKHISSHKIYKCFLCPNCDELFNDEENFINHCKNCKKQPKYSCNICSINLFSTEEVNKHENHHKNKEIIKELAILKEEFICLICKKIFPTKSLFNKHNETENHNNICPLTNCQKIFNTKEKLRSHMSLHNENPKYICNICEKKFPIPQYLKIHMRIHQEDKKFACGDCNLTFKRRDHLTRHLRIHQSVKEFRCNFDGCSKAFHRTDKLKLHLKTHEIGLKNLKSKNSKSINNSKIETNLI